MISEHKIPDNWELKKIKNIATVTSGYTFSSDKFQDEGVPLLKIENVSNDYFEFDDHLPKNVFEQTKDKYILDGGEILLALSGNATTGEVTIYEDDKSVLLNQRIASIDPQKDLMSREFIFTLIKSPIFKREISKNRRRGGGPANIRLSDVREFTVPVPPLDEQERIVEAVEERLDRIERLEKSVENVGRLQEEYEDSLLSYLLTGRDLSQEKIPESEDWLGQIPENWEVKKLRNIGNRVSSMTEPESGSTYSLYSFDSVDDGSGYYEVDGADIGSRKRELNGGEVMISRLNPRINRVQKVDFEHKHAPIASSEFVAIDVEDYVSQEYLYEYLRNPILQERLTNHVTGSTGSRSRVGFDFVMDSIIPVPPRSTQKEIVDNIRRVDFAILEKSYSDVSKLFEEYRNSVLSHAFIGKVT